MWLFIDESLIPLHLHFLWNLLLYLWVFGVPLFKSRFFGLSLQLFFGSIIVIL